MEGKTRQSKTHAHRDGGAKTRKWRDSAAKPAETLGSNQTKSQILNIYSCQEGTLSSVKIYDFSQIAKIKNPAQEVHLATSKTGQQAK